MVRVPACQAKVARTPLRWKVCGTRNYSHRSSSWICWRTLLPQGLRRTRLCLAARRIDFRVAHGPSSMSGEPATGEPSWCERTDGMVLVFSWRACAWLRLCKHAPRRWRGSLFGQLVRGLGVRFRVPWHQSNASVILSLTESLNSLLNVDCNPTECIRLSDCWGAVRDRASVFAIL